MKTFLPISIISLLLLWGCTNKTTTGPEIFRENFQTRSAAIVPIDELEKHDVPFILTRLKNKKISLMTRDKSGEMKPFFVRGIETGFWDTRKPNTDYDEVFKNFNNLNSNTALFMVHWWDIEPEEGVFDFSFTDMIVEKAAAHSVKIWWVLFLHTQPGLMNVDEKAWMYRVDASEEADSVIQWVKTKDGTMLKTLEGQLAEIGKQYHAYGHPKMLTLTKRMIQQLAMHYKDNENVIGVQIGNEEGFNTRGVSDYNPYTLKLYDQWNLETGKVDTLAFKKDVIDACWKQYTTAFHEVDPYKLTSFNLNGGMSEAGLQWFMKQNGTSSTTYRDGNIDVIGTMFYRDLGDDIWRNLDLEYTSYTYDLPILIPSEIGIGRKGTPRTWGLINILRTLERGGLGYGVYCYGDDMYDKHGIITKTGILYKNLACMIKVNEDILCEAVPGIGSLKMTSDVSGLKVSQLKGIDGDVLSILYFPELTMDEKADECNEKMTINLTVKAIHPGNYNIDVYYDGELKQSNKYNLKKQEILNIQISDLVKNKAVFVTARSNN